MRCLNKNICSQHETERVLHLIWLHAGPTLTLKGKSPTTATQAPAHDDIRGRLCTATDCQNSVKTKSNPPPSFVSDLCTCILRHPDIRAWVESLALVDPDGSISGTGEPLTQMTELGGGEA